MAGWNPIITWLQAGRWAEVALGLRSWDGGVLSVVMPAILVSRRRLGSARLHLLASDGRHAQARLLLARPCWGVISCALKRDVLRAPLRSRRAHCQGSSCRRNPEAVGNLGGHRLIFLISISRLFSGPFPSDAPGGSRGYFGSSFGSRPPRRKGRLSPPGGRLAFAASLARLILQLGLLPDPGRPVRRTAGRGATGEAISPQPGGDVCERPFGRIWGGIAQRLGTVHSRPPPASARFVIGSSGPGHLAAHRVPGGEEMALAPATSASPRRFLVAYRAASLRLVALAPASISEGGSMGGRSVGARLPGYDYHRRGPISDGTQDSICCASDRRRSASQVGEL
jgi:hypothetical protein